MQKIPRLLLTTAVLCTATALAGGAQDRNTAITATNGEAIHEHLDEVEDALETLLDWRHVLTTATSQPRETRPPTAPSTTLISVPRPDVERLASLISAVLVMVPAPSAAAAAPRGDLRAHAEKAQEIARELMPIGTAGPVGTSGGATVDMILVDRSALERLEVEVDAMERVAPRRISSAQ